MIQPVFFTFDWATSTNDPINKQSDWFSPAGKVGLVQNLTEPSPLSFKTLESHPTDNINPKKPIVAVKSLSKVLYKPVALNPSVSLCTVRARDNFAAQHLSLSLSFIFSLFFFVLEVTSLLWFWFCIIQCNICLDS